MELNKQFLSLTNPAIEVNVVKLRRVYRQASEDELSRKLKSSGT